MNGAEHRPLAFDLFKTAQEELSEASSVLDVSEYRFDELFSEPIALSPSGTTDFVGHGLHHWFAFDNAISGWVGLVMADATRRKVGPHPVFGDGGEIGLAGKAGVT